MKLAGRSVCRLGYGCFPLTGGYGAVTRATALRTIAAVLDAGVAVLDTADAYADGENERIVGAAIAGRRDSAVLVTKFGWVVDGSGNAVRRDSSPAHVRRACDASLRRLGTDYVDVYLQHRLDPTVRIEDTLGALMDLQAQGKIRSFGLCEVSNATLHRATQTVPIDVLQTEYSLWSREPEKELLPACDSLGIVFMAYSPLGRGFLTGAIRSPEQLEAADFRRGQPRFEPQNMSRNIEAIDAVRLVAQRNGQTASQAALAWLLCRTEHVMPIPSTRSIEHFLENMKALEMQLSPDEIGDLERSIAGDSIHGERHPPEHMKTVNI